MTAYYASSVGFTFRSVIILVLQSVWAFRLASYLYMRNHGSTEASGKEDFRYAQMRKKIGPTFWWKAFGLVFLPQSIAQFLVGLPLLLAVQHDPKTDSAVSWTDVLGVVVFAFGLYCEVRADMELTAWKHDPNHSGQLLTTGIWSVRIIRLLLWWWCRIESSVIAIC